MKTLLSKSLLSSESWNKHTHIQKKALARIKTGGWRGGQKKGEIASLMHPACCPEPFPFACAQREPFLSGQRTPFTRPLVIQGQMHPGKFPPVLQVRAKEQDKAEPHSIRPAGRRLTLRWWAGRLQRTRCQACHPGTIPSQKLPLQVNGF